MQMPDGFPVIYPLSAGRAPRQVAPRGRLPALIGRLRVIELSGLLGYLLLCRLV